MADKTFTCTVLTPERRVLETPATFAAIPAYDGEIGIMHDRAPLLCRLGIGILRLETPAGTQRIYVDAGFAEVIDNRVTVLTERAALPAEIDADAERAAEAEARARRAVSEDEQGARLRDIQRATTRLRLVSGN